MAASDLQSTFNPPIPRRSRAWQACCRCVKELMKVEMLDAEQTERIRAQILHVIGNGSEQAQFARAACSVLCDLRSQGWSFRLTKKGIRLEAYKPIDREEVRAFHARRRDEQLKQASVRQFIRGMEKRRIGNDDWVSIYSLMRDGRGLAAALRKANQCRSEAERITALRKVVDPYLQFADENAVCPHTGLRLIDIWRYFRHTWANEYTTVPGRTMHVLVRDRAVKNHPVIGIAALASPVVQLNNRDRWLGWTSAVFLESLRKEASAAWAKWVRESLDDQIGEIYTDDFISERLLSRKDIDSPTPAVIKRLREFGEKARDAHRLHPNAKVHKTPTDNMPDSEWQTRAVTDLFRWKRAVTLADLLDVRRTLRQLRFTNCSKEALLEVLSSADGRRAIDCIRRQVKGRFIGNNILDITVCGAMPPYNELLGGKLVAMLLTSPEVCVEYGRRYGKAASLIASSMAGHGVYRHPQLTVLTTTSLYGPGLNQYTRISIPASIVKSDDTGNSVKFRELGATEGQGSLQFSNATLHEIKVVLRQQKSGPKIHSIFGEGVSPKLRKIRTALEVLGFPSDLVLTHGSVRAMYGATLVANARDVLLGKQKRPKYILSGESPDAVSQAICGHWAVRWAMPRIARDEVLDRLERHTLVRPVTHGARVVLPPVYEEEPLFYGRE